MRPEFLTSQARPIGNRPQDAILHYKPAAWVDGNLMGVDPIEGHRLWAPCYDSAPNPLLALEMRILAGHIGEVKNLRILDAGCGTGRWMRAFSSRGAGAFGIDACYEMLEQAPCGSALGDIEHIPLSDDAFDLAICSFALGYVSRPQSVIDELARVARRVIVTDLHPAAAAAGWTRSFRAGEQVVHLRHYNHSIAELDAYAQHAGLTQEHRVEAPFGETEREIFARAGKPKLFDQVSRLPAVLATIWRR